MTDNPRAMLLKTVKDAIDAGLCVIPPSPAGTKRPLPGGSSKWQEYQKSAPTPEKLREWYLDKNVTGIGLGCGVASGNLECLDVDERGIYVLFRQRMIDVGLEELLYNLEHGYMEYTPNGVHLLYRCETISGNTKLATRPKKPEEIRDLNDKTKTLLETRGTGGYIIIAPTYGPVNPSGSYELVSGSLSTIPTITPDERQALHDVARTFNVLDDKQLEFEKRQALQGSKIGGRPGDDFNRRATMGDILTAHGWTPVFTRDDTIYWRRPGKAFGISATTNHQGSDLLYVFSSSTPFEPNQGYTKFSVYAILEHGGDFSVAARELTKQGYGDPMRKHSPAGENCLREDSEILEWQEPLLPGEIETPEISASLLPSWLGDYAAAVSENTQTPTGLAVMMGLATAATCLQKRIEVAPYGDDYREPVSIWPLTGLPPASRKTAVKSSMTEPLTTWEREQALSLADEIKKVSRIRAVNLKRIESLTKKAADQEDPLERQIIIDEIERLERDTPEELRPPRLLVDDITPERVQGILAENGERAGLISDEGGIFEIMAGLYSNGKANLNVFLQAHAGAPVRVDRQSRTGYLERPALTIALTIQPDVISDLSRGGKGRFRGNGLLARFLYCIPKNNIGTRNVTRRTPIPETIKAQYQAGIYDLLSIEPLKDDQGRETPRILTLSPDALNAWETFAQYIENMQGPNGELESIQDWSGKLPGAALRIAGLFHVIEHGTAVSVINQQTIEQSLDLCDLLIPHAKAAFELMGDDPAYHDAKHAYQWILVKGEPSFRQNEAFKELRRFRQIDRLEKALKVLTDRQIISEPIKRGTGGRPSIIFIVNPELKNLDHGSKGSNGAKG